MSYPILLLIRAPTLPRLHPTVSTPPAHHSTPPTCTVSRTHVTRRAVLHSLALALTSVPVLCLPSSTQARPRGLPRGYAETVLRNVTFPATWPYTAADFARVDEQPDTVFYTQPRLTRHIDDAAADALSAFYRSTLLPTAPAVLDLCSSVETYMPPDWSGRRRLSLLGLNASEMRAAPSHPDDVIVQDLNVVTDKKGLHLASDTASFDLVTCALSIDYLTEPVAVLREVARLLKKGGRVAISFSDRLFFSKAVAIWTGGGDEDHIYTVASYLHYAGAFAQAHVVDLSPRRINGDCVGDPLYVVVAERV